VQTDRVYEIHEVAELTGLATARLRAWERRYEVVRPRRMANRYRVYTAEQVALLRAFARLVVAGERIGSLVKQPREAVIERAEGEVAGGTPLAPLLEAVKRLDREQLAILLGQHRRSMPIEAFVNDVAFPLGDLIGDLWALGRLSVAAEHLASEVMVPLLKAEFQIRPTGRPIFLSACLPGERHEWGVLGHLAIHQHRGWKVVYLGPDLPLRDLIDAAWTRRPDLIGLSSSDPANLEQHMPELRRLPRLLPPEVLVIIAGQGADGNSTRLRRSGFRVGESMVPDIRRPGARPG
jgi:DNA-binding transcriptional MerR regulator